MTSHCIKELEGTTKFTATVKVTQYDGLNLFTKCKVFKVFSLFNPVEKAHKQANKIIQDWEIKDRFSKI